MNIIGKTRTGLLIDITESELEKVLNSYYQQPIDGTKLGKTVASLKAGDTLDGALIYNFNDDLKRTAKDMVTAINSFKSTQDTLLKFATLLIEDKRNEQTEN
jgi:hypothetical protein